MGRYTYTTDLRFEALHSPHTDDWIVRLKNPRPSDSGIYGCQISTTPHRTQLVYLTVHGKLKKFFNSVLTSDRKKIGNTGFIGSNSDTSIISFDQTM